MVGRDCVAIGDILRTTAVVDAMVDSFGEVGPVARFPSVDLRVDLSAPPLTGLRFLCELYRPELDACVVRAVDPDKAATPA